MGVWGKTWNRAVVFRGRGGFRVFPSAFLDRSPPPACASIRIAEPFPTSPSCSMRGVRSGTWRRRGASTYVQAGGETETETPRTAPASAGAVRVRAVRHLKGLCAECPEPVFR
jgi:hypothetical protein